MVNEKKDLIFFKSAYTDIYKRRILSCLSLPPEYFFETEFRKKYVSDAVWNRAEQNETEFKGKKASFIFVDLHAQEVKFYPIREVTIHYARCAGDFFKIGVKMGNYYKYNDEELKAFNKKLGETIKDLPKLGTGIYAQFCDISSLCENLKATADSSVWIDLVDYLAKTAPKNFEKSTFFWLSLKDELEQKPELLEFQNEIHFVLRSDKRYHFDFQYYNPNYDKLDKMDLSINFNMNDYCFETSSKSLDIPSNTKNATEKLNFSCRKVNKDQYPQIEVKREDSPSNAPNPKILVKIPYSFWDEFFSMGTLLFVAGLTFTSFVQILDVIPDAIKIPLSIAGTLFSSLGVLQLTKK